MSAVFEVGGHIPSAPGGFVFGTGASSGGNGPVKLAVGGISGLPNSVSSTSYSAQLIPSFGIGPYTSYSLIDSSCDLTSATAGTPPTPGNTFSLSSTGLLTCASISATPEGDYFLVSYVDSTSTTFKQNFACFNGANPLRIVTPSNLGLLTQGNVYTSGSPLVTMKAAGNLSSITWSITSQTTTGTTNNTWSINSGTGTITGTATNAGVNTLTVQATDGTNTTTETYNIGVYSVVTGASRPSFNPASGVNSQGIPCGPGFFVLNGELYEPNGALFKLNHGFDATFPSDNESSISTPRYNAMGMNVLRIIPESTSLSNETTEVAASTTQHTNNHRFTIQARYNDYSGTVFSGSSNLTLLGSAIQEWIGAYSTIYSALMNKIAVNITNEWGTFAGSQTGFAAAYSAVSAPVTALTTTTLTFSGASPFNVTNIGLGFVYILGSTWSGANNDGLYAVSASGTNTVTGTFPTGYVSGGTVWGGCIGMLRAAKFYCPLVVDASGGNSYADLINNGVAIFQSDPLQSTIMSYHAYYNGNTGSNTQAGFESAICVPMNTNKVNSGVPWILGEMGVYYPDGRAGSPTGGLDTNFPTPQYLQSSSKYGVPCLGWISYNGGSPRADSTAGFAWYTTSSGVNDASDAGHPSAFSVFGKRVTLHPIYGSIVNSTGVATSF